MTSKNSDIFKPTLNISMSFVRPPNEILNLMEGSRDVVDCLMRNVALRHLDQILRPVVVISDTGMT
jgi:hypothetical protein